MIKVSEDNLLAISTFGVGHDMPVCKKPLDDPTPTTLTERQALTVQRSD